MAGLDAVVICCCFCLLLSLSLTPMHFAHSIQLKCFFFVVVLPLLYRIDGKRTNKVAWAHLAWVLMFRCHFTGFNASECDLVRAFVYLFLCAMMLILHCAHNFQFQLFHHKTVGLVTVCWLYTVLQVHRMLLCRCTIDWFFCFFYCIFVIFLFRRTYSLARSIHMHTIIYIAMGKEEQMFDLIFHLNHFELVLNCTTVTCA